MKAKISIIVPIYNTEKYVRQCVKSIQSQTFTDLEIILVDDGSTDSSGKICDELAQNDNRIKVIHKPNGGLSDARNAGIAASTAEYIALLDSDDYILPDWLKNLYTLITASDADFVKGGILYVEQTDDTAENVALDYSTQPFKKIILTDEIISSKEFVRRLLTYEGYNCVWNQLIKAEFYKKFPFPKGHLNEDYHTLLAMSHELKKVQLTSVAGVCYRQRVGSISNMKKDSLIIDMIDDDLLHHDIFLSRFNDPENASVAITRAVELFFFYLASAQRLNSIKAQATKDVWQQLYPVTKNYDMKKLLPKVLYMQYRIYSISENLYYHIMRIKKAVAK